MGEEGKLVKIWIRIGEQEGAISIQDTATVDDLREKIKSDFFAGKVASPSMVVKSRPKDTKPLKAALQLQNLLENCADKLEKEEDGNPILYVEVPVKENEAVKKVVVGDYRMRFGELLGFQVDAKLFSILESRYFARYKNICKHGGKEAASDLFKEAAAVPGATTTVALREQAHLAISPLPFPTNSESAAFFFANDPRTAAHKIVKYPTHKYAEQELKACRELHLDTMQLGDHCALTPVVVHDILIRREEEEEEGGSSSNYRQNIVVMVMPQFASTLAYPPKWLEPAYVFSGAQRIIRALNYIHKANYVHMDVKGNNIFMDVAGRWYLGDFGSCVLVDTPITS